MNRLLAIGAVVLLSGPAQAAVITWGGVSDYSSESDVSTQGALVEAINACGVSCQASPLVNGVPFTASTTLMSQDACTDFLSGNSGSIEYNQLLGTLDYGSSQISVGAGLLEAGKEYRIQVWYVDERSSSAGNRSMVFGDGNGNVSAWVDDQYVSGTFTADGSSQTLTVTGYNNSNGGGATTHITAYQIRDLSSPVPTLTSPDTDVYGDFSVQVDFSEAVSGLSRSDFAVTGGTVSGLTGSGASYSVVVSPNFGGDVVVSLPANVVTDLDGDNHQNVASEALVTAYHVMATVTSLPDLLPYLPQSNVDVVMSPGVYTLTAADVVSTFGTPRFEFWGNDSTYEFSGVTIQFAADIYTSDLSMSHVQIFGNRNVLKNLTMVDLCDVHGSLSLAGGVNLVMDGASNRVEGFHMTIKGSYPYGYGDCFGKGATWTIKHSKHSGLLVRGESNHVKNCTLIQRSYGHCIFMQAASNPIIEGCYVEGEMRSTDDMLAEAGTGSPADLINFMTVWGYPLPPGYTKSTTEAGIRAYNAGNTYIDGLWYSRGTSNPTIIDNTLVNTRVGVTLTHASGTKYVSGCTAIGTERGYAIGSGIIENCSADVEFGPAFGVDYESDDGVVADIAILPHSGRHYNGSRHFAYILGSDHNLTFRGMEPSPDQTLEINVGGDKRIIGQLAEIENFNADDIIVNNLTGYPLILDDDSSGTTGQSIGVVTNDGTGNAIVTTDWSITSNLAFYGRATQSSTSYDAIASLATDQNTSGNWNDGSVTHTSSEAQPWWRIDLGHTYDISEIRIWGRTDSCCRARLSNYDVTILDDDELPVWTSYQAGYPDPMVSLNTGSVTGRQVRIQLRGTDPLSLAEVQIYGSRVDPAPDIAVATTVSMDAPTVSSNDLAQTHYFSSSATGGGRASRHAQLFNGEIGNKDGDAGDAGEVELTSTNTVTVTLDTSIHTNGYDVTGIRTCFGWDTSGGGRANQGYEVILTGVDGLSETWAGPATWEPNAPIPYYWTTVTLEERAGGLIASGIKAVTFNMTDNANTGGAVVAREIDLFGTPTVAPVDPMPSFVSDGMMVSNGLLVAQVAGALGEAYMVEWAPSLTQPWELLDFVGPLGSTPFILSVPTTNLTGFYRVQWSP